MFCFINFKIKMHNICHFMVIYREIIEPSSWFLFRWHGNSYFRVRYRLHTNMPVRVILSGEAICWSKRSVRHSLDHPRPTKLFLAFCDGFNSAVENKPEFIGGEKNLMKADFGIFRFEIAKWNIFKRKNIHYGFEKGKVWTDMMYFCYFSQEGVFSR